MKTVLFVCTGNTCRSPMAEAIARSAVSDGRIDLASQENLEIFSAGLHAVDGAPLSHEAAELLHERGLQCSGRSVRLTAEMARKADLVLGMTSAHVAGIRGLLDGLLLIEQPLHRDIALQHSLHSWKDRPPLIIDESDGTLDSLPSALNLGYDGTSHKNCKGIVKGLANAALLNKRQLEQPEKNFLLTGEDLANVGPIALNQDLAIVAALGIPHVERNGHHYFRGLSMFPGKLSEELALPDLYRIHEDGFPTLDIRDGRLNLSRVNNTPFGTEHLLDSAQFTPLSEWSVESLA
ncbi:MAG: hypothetical protein OSA95_07550 [Opitutales bacterium]|nr:hypothetical protein [Opitutales bacterium]